MSVLVLGPATSYHSRHAMSTFAENTRSTESSEYSSARPNHDSFLPGPFPL
jgi:hypothetical protein